MTLVTAQIYAEHPLVILGQEEKEEIARVTADEMEPIEPRLPLGDCILDGQGRAPQASRLRFRRGWALLSPKRAGKRV